MKLSLLLPLLVLILMTARSVHAAPDMTGSARYQFGANNATVSFGCDRIINTSSENATGTIMLKLWAMDAPYKGGTLNGYLLGSYKLEALAGGNVYNRPNQSVKCTLPPKRKHWYLCLALTEYRKGGYVIVDHMNFDNTVLIGVPPRQFTLTGPWSWQVSGDYATVDMNVAKISHTRTGNTGSLRLALWATKQPYTGGRISGFEIGMVQKKALDPGYNYSNVQNTAKFVKPPAGTYYVTLLLLEYDGGEYVIKHWLPGSKTTTFR